MIMSSILIRDIPEKFVEVLKQRAVRNNRSLQKELKHILITIAQETPLSDSLPPIELRFSKAEVTSDWQRKDIYDNNGR